MAELISVIAEPRRREIMNLLRGGEMTVSALAEEFSVTRPAVSQHLKALLDAGLLEVRQQGRKRFYALNPQGLAVLRSELENYWAKEFDDLIESAQKTQVSRKP